MPIATQTGQFDTEATALLALESSGATCSVAACLPSGQWLLATDSGQNNHAAALTLLVQEVLEGLSLKVADLGAIAVSIGPGSYTGLRIGLSAAKGLSLGAGIPILPIPSLRAIALGIRKGTEMAQTAHPGESGRLAPQLSSAATLSPQSTFYLPLIDARRLECYAQLYNADIAPLGEPFPLILPEWLPSIPAGANVHYGGSGAAKAESYFAQHGWVKSPYTEASALEVLQLARTDYGRISFPDPAYLEPLYLKEFQASQPKPSVLDTLVGHGPTGL